MPPTLPPQPPNPWQQVLHTSQDALIESCFLLLDSLAQDDGYNKHHYYHRFDIAKTKLRIGDYSMKWPSLCVFKCEPISGKFVTAHFCRRRVLAAPLLDLDDEFRGLAVNIGFTAGSSGFSDAELADVVRPKVVALVDWVSEKRSQYFGDTVTGDYSLEALISASFRIPLRLQKFISLFEGAASTGFRIEPQDLVVTKEGTALGAKKAWTEVIYFRRGISKVDTRTERRSDASRS